MLIWILNIRDGAVVFECVLELMHQSRSIGLFQLSAERHGGCLGKAWLRTAAIILLLSWSAINGEFKSDFPESGVSDDGEDSIKQYGEWLRVSPRKTFNRLGS